MPTLIAKPTRVEASGNNPTLADEYVGRVNSATSQASLAHMQSPVDGRNPAKPRNSPSLRQYCEVSCAWIIVEARWTNRQ
ncbi:MAG: hypothetical protein NTW28_19780 [Candidatus Solibacter sp.]|nr:hypothetical protein [Candidatus Solibacter sp.]